MSQAMRIPQPPPDRGRLMSVKQVVEWIEARVPDKKRSPYYVRAHIPKEYRRGCGNGIYYWEADVEKWFYEAFGRVRK